MKIFVFIFLLSTSAPIMALDNYLRPFETDGCTMFFDGPPKQPGLWRHCCVEHDMRYWFGGDHSDLNQTDLRLKSCVNKVAGPVWAAVIYDGVRMGHSSPVKNKMRWSWGWFHKRADIKLSKEESQYVIEELRRLPFDQVVIDQFIERNFPGNHEAL